MTNATCFVCGGGTVNGHGRCICLDCRDEGKSARDVARSSQDALALATRLAAENTPSVLVVRAYTGGGHLVRFFYNITALPLPYGGTLPQMEGCQEGEVLFIVRGRPELDRRIQRHSGQTLAEAIAAFEAKISERWS